MSALPNERCCRIFAYLSVVILLTFAHLTTFAQSSTDAPSQFSAGLTALEKQNFRAAADAFRSAYLLDSANMTYLRHFAKALLYAEFKNIDSVRFVQQLMQTYALRGGEANALLAEKGKILTNDVDIRIDALVQDSLREAQRLATRYVSQYQYSYRATAQKPQERPKDSVSLAGTSVWRASLLIQAGAMIQPNATLDHWGDVNLRFGAAFWGTLGEGADIGGDVGLLGSLGAMLESGSIPTRADTGTALRRLYAAEFAARCRVHLHTVGVVSLGAVAHVENAQKLGLSGAEDIATSALVGTPFHLLGAGIGWEPRDGAEGLIFSGRYFFFPFLGTNSETRMMTAQIGYAFGRAALVVDGAYAERSRITTGSASTAISTLSARVGLHWHFLQAITAKKEEE
jgi:hypothetical protein